MIVFFLVFYVILKKQDTLASKEDPRLLNVKSAEHLLKGIEEKESDEMIDNLRDCLDRTQHSRSLIQNFINQDTLAYQGHFKLNFENLSDRDESVRLESVYESEPEMIKSYKTIVISELSASKKSSMNRISGAYPNK